MIVRRATEADAAAAVAIHAAGVATGEATFGDTRYDAEQWLGTYVCRVVAEADGAILGWAGASRPTTRSTYVGAGQTSVYVAPEAAGRGAGRALMHGLVAASEADGFWTLWSHVFAENAASLAIHRAAGFRVLGVRERCGRMTFGPRAGQWRDVVVLERRSAVVGVD